MTAAPRAHRPSTEAALVERAAEFAAGRGYRTYVDPDGSSYFDLVVRRAAEVGLVEAKLGHARALLAQALRRRAWGDWVAVVLPSVRLAERLVTASDGRRAAPVGVWALDGDTVRELRPASPFPFLGEGDPFRAVREQLRRVLDRLDTGETPAGLPWDGVLGEVRRASGGRRFGEWRLDERP